MLLCDFSVPFPLPLSTRHSEVTAGASPVILEHEVSLRMEVHGRKTDPGGSWAPESRQRPCLSQSAKLRLLPCERERDKLPLLLKPLYSGVSSSCSQVNPSVYNELANSDCRINQSDLIKNTRTDSPLSFCACLLGQRGSSDMT